MNYPLLSRYLGFFIVASGLAVIAAAPWAIYFAEWAALRAIFASIAVSAGVGLLLIFLGRRADSRHFYQREALGLVGLSWILICVLGALPLIFSGMLGPVDAVFESVSGFTTTGASVLTPDEFDSAPRSIMFWRSFTHFLGGIGIVVLFLAVLPYLGAGGKQIFRSEHSGPESRSLRPRIRDTATFLLRIYIGLTAIQVVALMLAGMDLYDSLCHSFATIATGGFSTRVDSIAYYDSAAIEVIIMVFMMAGGTNFALYFGLASGKWSALVRDSEWRLYIVLFGAVTLLVAANILGFPGIAPTMADGQTIAPQQHYDDPVTALRTAAFQVISIGTSTGFATADYNVWPHFSRAALFFLMFVGACGGSTSGGIKIIRLLMLFKMAYWRLESTFRPKTIRPLRVGDELVDESIQRMVYGFFVLYCFWFVFGSLFMAALGLDFESALSSVIATMSNIGPGLGLVGPATNFDAVPAIGKIYLSFCMILGRLEIFCITVMFVPSFWRRA